MNDPKTVWERYVLSWNVHAATERRALYATCLSPHCVYTDPLTRTRGWNELEQYMVGFHEQLPGARFITESFLAHHGRSIARWKMLRGDVVLGEGTSYGEYDDDQRLVTMTGFYETAASATPA